MSEPNSETPDFRSGFVCFVGRPNAGKSTLTNALVGQKIAITSGRPQTTRHTVRGIVNRDSAQVILIDTPGLHRPRTLLGERLNDVVRETLLEVDAIAMCIPADQKIGPGDTYIAEEITQITQSRRATPIIAVVTKSDTVTRADLAAQLVAVDAIAPWTAVIPVSAVADEQLEELVELLAQQLPEGPKLYPDGDLTDEPEAVMVAELVREAALEGVREELPHSLAVLVDEIVPRDPQAPPGSLLDVRVTMFVERDSQKGIIIGRGGSRLKEIGSTARKSIEALLGSKIYLDLRVKVAKDWQRDPKQLHRLGF